MSHGTSVANGDSPTSTIKLSGWTSLESKHCISYTAVE
uniref:Uncharacterized protein n=1 Tax=Anguilla anguilla TaxID=7936 RepID=A0A0E9QQ46_ANGAN